MKFCKHIQSQYLLAKLLQAERHPRAVCIQQQPNYSASCVQYGDLQLLGQFIGYGALPIRDKQDVRIFERLLVISRNASRIGGSKSVPPSKKCSAAESRSSGVYCPGRNRSVRNSFSSEKWMSANFRPSCAQMSCTAKASALPHAAFSPSVEADSSRQTMISPCPLWTRSRLAYCSSPFALYLRRNSGTERLRYIVQLFCGGLQICCIVTQAGLFVGLQGRPQENKSHAVALSANPFYIHAGQLANAANRQVCYIQKVYRINDSALFISEGHKLTVQIHFSFRAKDSGPFFYPMKKQSRLQLHFRHGSHCLQNRSA